MSREPLAALVARLRDENGALPFAETWARVTPSEAKRLLAAVEAGQKCADALEVYRQHRDGDWSLAMPSEDLIRRGRDADEVMRAALDEWAKVAEAPASHGSPEQGR